MKIFQCRDCLLEFKDSQKAIDHSFDKGHRIKVEGVYDGHDGRCCGEKEAAQVSAPVVQDGNDPQRIG